jgi:HTH-type transcriptional regulator / antitoxin MqsA
MTRANNDLDSCALCGGPVPRVRTELTMPFPGREPAVVSRVLQKCTDCGECYLAPDELDAVQRAAADIVRAREGLLAPDEILAIRQSMHLSQSAFERLIGAGAKTVVRWERGTIFQSKVTDTLMRVLRAVPEAREFLSANARVTA